LVLFGAFVDAVGVAAAAVEVVPVVVFGFGPASVALVPRSAE
jgi:hypothetical protein